MPKRLEFDRRGPGKSAKLFLDKMSLGDVLQRLAVLAPEDVRAIDVLAREALLRRIRQLH